MAGIICYGAYIPMYRLSRAEIAKIWGGKPGGGEKSVANFDEDTITMGVEAVTDCIAGLNRPEINGLYFASNTPPYQEKQSASIVAAATDLRRDLTAIDFGNSIRAGTLALKAAVDAVNAGSLQKVVVASAECRVPAPNSETELSFGDGAAALLIGNSDLAVEFEGGYNISSEFMDMWKTKKDTYLRTWEDRFIYDDGYHAHMREVITGLFQKYNLTAKDFTKVILYAPDARRHRELATRLGFDYKTQVQDPMFDQVGNTGAAFALMMLVAALEEAKPGDRLLLVNYGDGAEAHILRVTEQIEKVRDRRGIKHHLASKLMLPNYGKYAHFRDIMEWEFERRTADTSTLTLLWRERNQIIRGHGGKCKHCGCLQFPIQRICANCHTKDQYEEVRISDNKGILFSYALEERAPSKDLPNVMSIVDLEGDCRFYCSLTDRGDPERIEVGMPVELTFRNMHDGAGLHNYYWKARPVRA